MRWLALLLMAFALVAAGCGGAEESPASEEPTIEETLTETTTQKSWNTWTEVARGEYCGNLLYARVLIAGAFIDPGSVSQEGLDELASESPREIRADVETIVEALATYTEEVGDDPTPFEMEAALASRDPQEEAAEKRLKGWLKKNCL